eukprot:m.23644 g.23644  ORF g.23644 m.23644 type:complete len:267 (+) comp7525_c0_seq2:237-1037(+)
MYTISRNVYLTYSFSRFIIATNLTTKMEPSNSQLEAWRTEQQALAERLITIDDHKTWDLDKGLRYIGGVDISFVKDNNVDACAMVSVLEYPSLKVVRTESAFVKLTAPYIPGFLAFREVDHICALLDKIQQNHPEVMPQVIMVDGNGILHPKRLGLASHLGIIRDIPTIGVAKKIIDVDGLLEPWKKKRLSLNDAVPLVGNSGQTWGMAVTSTSSAKPVFVSIGHRVSLHTAVELTKRTTKFRIPEPIRSADLTSRDIVRDTTTCS